MKRAKEKKRFNNAYDYSLYLLSFRARSEKEIIQRLHQKSYPEEDIQDAVQKLKNYKFVDDNQTAACFIASRMRSGKGEHAIRQELLQKGYGSDIIHEQIILVQKELPSEFDRALQVARKKSAGWKNSAGNNRIQRLISFLRRKGFSSGTVYKVVKEFQQEKGAVSAGAESFDETIHQDS